MLSKLEMTATARGLVACPEKVTQLAPIADVDSQDICVDAYLEKLRPELYAIASIFIDEIVTRGIHNPVDADDVPYSMIEKEPINVVGAVANRLTARLSGVFTDSIEEVSNKVPRLYERFSDLTAFFQRVSPARRYVTPVAFLLSGIGTASVETPTAVFAASRVLRQKMPELTSDEHVSVLRKSSGILRAVAAVNKDHIQSVSAINCLAGNPIYNGSIGSNLQMGVVETRAGTRVVYLDEIANMPDRFGSDRDKTIGEHETSHSTLGCPALLNIGSGVAIKKLWEFTVDHVVEHGLLAK